MQIGYSARLDQVSPGAVIDAAVEAEKHGFRGVMASDHFQPWLSRHAASSHVWTMLGALGAQTSHDLGPGVTTPSFRTHPAVVAQAAATLASLYPGRGWLGLGSGEAINEHVVGEYWPEPPERIDRMFEAIEIIKKLFAASIVGRDVRHKGEHFRMESTRLWTMPPTAPPLYVAAGGPVTARRAGRVADGFITNSAPSERLAPLLTRFFEGAREAGRDGSRMPRIVHVHVSWAPTDDEALRNAVQQWPLAGLRAHRSDIRSPFDVDQLVRSVSAEDVASGMVVSSDPDHHRAELQRLVDLGFDRIYVHNVGRDQRTWLEVFGREVIPGVRA